MPVTLTDLMRVLPTGRRNAVPPACLAVQLRCGGGDVLRLVGRLRSAGQARMDKKGRVYLL
jgi:hypothetical protein